ncbi:cation:proton antiporter domain-containing protein [Natronococcus wangiae]|uniref:cation:proton antiporter domain-containing protein n=1 Tax=Natronococcus wangiae TaxID=3068275 RepID=UPI00273E6974|nr:cation:proton antiporter [Natronococcus sp. AD5]
MEPLNVALALLGGLLLALNLSSEFVTDRVPVLSQPLLATAFGAAVGPAGLGLLVLSAWGDPIAILEHVARVTVGFAVVGIALRVPVQYVRRRAAALAVVLGPGMVSMWLASSALVYVLLGVPERTALLLGAIVTPTDPVIANTIVTGSLAESQIPDRLRRFLSTEAGANDGLAYPFVFLAIFALSHPLEGALSRWLVDAALVGVGGAVALGAFGGTVVGVLEREAERRGALLGTSDVLAAFVAGMAYNTFANPRDEALESEVQDAIKRLLTIPAFVVFGAALPWAEWRTLGAAGVALGIAIVLLRRLPAWLAIAPVVAPLRTRDDALFVGWFGPIGVAALLYATISVRETGTEIGWIVGSLVIAASIVAHGATATPLTNAYGRASRSSE